MSNTEQGFAHLEQALITAVSKVLGIDEHRVHAKESLSSYGFDSITLTQLANQLNEHFDFVRLDASTFLEYTSVAALHKHLYNRYAEELAGLFDVVAEAPIEIAVPEKILTDETPKAQGTTSRLDRKAVSGSSLLDDFEFSEFTEHSESSQTPTHDTIRPSTQGAAFEDIAIIGVAGQFPDADNIIELWENLYHEKNTLTKVPQDRWDWEAIYGDPESEDNVTDCCYGGFIKDLERFDPLFFGISPLEASQMDPQQKLVLQSTWETLENAGYSIDQLRGEDVGVFLGVQRNENLFNLMKTGENLGPYTNIGNTHSMLANRVSYFFDWKGNSLAVDTACSASSSALHLAYHALQRGEIQYALVGGVTVVQDSFSHVANRKMGLLTNKPQVRSFDKDSDGYLIGEGVATVLLKPVSQAEKDGDYIYGVIKSCAVNQGGKTVFLTAPDPAAHVKVIRSALQDAGLKPTDIDYIEGQGTGTALSDKAELKAYADVFSSDSKTDQKLGIGSIKGNIGHVESASGITALIKVCLSMKNGFIPPVLNFNELNWDQTTESPPFEVVGQQRLWHRRISEENIDTPRRAGVHNFGYGGLSAHFIVEEHANTCEARAGNTSNVPSNDELMLFSSKSQKQLNHYLMKLLHYLVNNKYQYFGIQQLRLADIAHTLQVGREDMPCRVAMVVASVEELIASLKQYLEGDTTPVTGVLTGSVDSNTEHRFSREQISPALYQNQAWHDIATRWIKGASRSEWLKQVWSGDLPSRGTRIPLPGYCFDFMTSKVEVDTMPFPLTEPQANPVAWLQFSTAFQRLEILAREGLFNGFQSWGICQTLGEILNPEQLENTLGIAAQHQRLFKVLLNILVRAGALQAVGENYRVVRVVCANTADLEEQMNQLVHDFPELETQVSLTWDCLQNLRAVLRDEMPATQILFPDASMQRVEGFYKGNPVIDHFNKQVSWHVLTAVHEMSQALPDQEKIRILEIGAGTGGITTGILKSIRGSAEHLHYVYSDISPGFTQFGQRTFGEDFPFLTFQVLDIEKDLAEQGFSEHSFDLIVASNVLHATANIQRTLQNTQRLLKPKGSLILNEVTDASDYISLTFGLLQGWWAFEDDAQRLPDGPLLNSAMWTDLLQQQGFASVDVYGNSGPDGQDSGYNVVVASLKERNVPTRTDVATQLPDGIIAADTSEKASALTPIASVNACTQTAKPPTLSQVSDVFAHVLMIDVAEIRINEPYVNYGVDSFTSLKIVKAINEALGVQLRSTELFNFPDITTLSHHIQQLPTIGSISEEAVKTPVNSKARQTPSATAAVDSIPAMPVATINKNAKIAVIGMSGRFPQAADTDEFWENLAASKDSIEKTPAHRWNGEQFWGGFVDDIDNFDPLFFNISPKEAEWMNPQQRLFLQEAWRTFEHAGYSSDAVKGSRCGVFVGSQESDYLKAFDQLEPNGYQGIGNSAAILSARIAYFLDLKGPSLSIDTACSSSLVAIHLACESIRSGTCEMALAGGISLLCTNESHRVLSKSGMLSPEGRCKTFDNSANGFVPAEAVGVVLLKPLDQALHDGDYVLGVIQAHGINQDGKTNGITASSSPSQSALQTETYQRFGINPERISYVEAHGTGTSLGDPIEIDALNDTFQAQTSRRQFCAVGSVKTNIGHTLAAAGVVGLIKVLLSLQHKQIPASLHFEKENQHFQLEKTAFYVNTELQPWESPVGEARQAAISSFGFSGTNAHCVVEEAPTFINTTNLVNNAPYLIPLSAKTAADLQDSVQSLADWLEQDTGNYQLNDVAATLLLGRTHFDYRIALVVEDWQELVTALKQVRQQPEANLFKVKPENEHSPALQHFAKQLLLSINDKTGHLQGAGYHETVLSLADLYQQGYPLEWQKIYQNNPASATVFRKVPLPTYPFIGQRYWLAPATSVVNKMVSKVTDTPPAFNVNPVDFPEQSSELRAFQRAYATLSPLCAVLLSSTLQTMGAFTTAGSQHSLTELSTLLQLEPKYACLLDAFMNILLEAGHVRQQGDDYVRIDHNPQAWQLPFDQVAKETQRLADKFPRIKAFVNLLAVCVQNYPEVLQGKLNATEVMFPSSSFDLVKGIYKENATADFYNQILVNNIVEHIRQALADPATPATLNILEIGAGTGGTSALLLSALKQQGFGERIRYLYTDISSGFVQYGRRTYGVDHPFARFEALDIEKPIASDCTYRQTFDIVVAANVIHATRDLNKTMDHIKTLMKPQGYLFLNEATDVQPFATMTYGLLDGWWLFEDDLRLDNSPLLGADKWVEFLQSKAFIVAPPQGLEGARKGPGQHILIAKHDIAKPRETVEPVKRQTIVSEDIVVTASTVPASAAIASPEKIKQQVQQEVMLAISHILGLQDDDLLLEKPFSDYGLDSISGIDFLSRINERLAIDVRVTALFDYPSVSELSVFIYDHYQVQLLNSIEQAFVQTLDNPLTPTGKLSDEACITPAVSAASVSTSAVEEPSSNEQKQTVSSDLAIIGMSGRFAGANDAHEFWDNLAAGTCSIDNPPADRWPAGSVSADYQAGFLQGIDQFDPLFFNWSGSESEQADPQQRIFLEEAYTALEDAGYPPRVLKDLKCGVFAGVGMSDYLMNMREQGYAGEAQTFWGNSPAVVPARISYFLNLKGPSIAIDTACSSSLVAMHTARQSILAGECDMALAGGVFLYTTPHFHTLAQKAQMLAPDSKCKAFDQNADGFVFGEGAGVVVLKRLDAALRDNDHIHAVLKASGANQDGKTNGITAPSSLSQAELEIAVYDEAGINPETISYVEAHGTGTKLGDPVEVAALTKAFGKYTDKKQFCHLGSVKPNIGHASLAAGIASVIKVIQSFSHEKIPPLLNFSEANEHIDFVNSPFLINTELHDWKSTQESPRRAAISGFGLSGTNAHLILEESPVHLSSHLIAEEVPVLICLSAKTADSLQQKIQDLIVYLQGRGQKYSLEHIAYSLHVGREHFKQRAAWVVRNRKQLLSLLQQDDAGVPVIAEALPVDLKQWMAQLSMTSFPLAEVLEKLSILGGIYRYGEAIDWQAMYRPEMRYRVPVPCYPFERSRFWFPEQRPAVSEGLAAVAPSAPALITPPLVAENLTEQPVNKTWWQPVWQPTALPTSSAQPTVKPLLVFGAIGYDVSFAQGRSVVLVVAGSEFALIDSGVVQQATLVVQLRPGQLVDYQQLVELLAQHNLFPEQILHAWPARAFALDTLTAHLDQGFYSVLFIAQALMQQTACPEKIHLLHAFTPTNTRDYALNQAISGFARTLNRENPKFFCQTLEIPQAGLLAEIAAMEFQRSVPNEVEIRYQKSVQGVLQRTVKTWKETHDLSDQSPEPVALKAKGTYLLLGGAGGLGRVFCQYLQQLAEKQSIHINVVLTGRHPSTPEKVQLIQAMQSRWCEISYVQVDIADPQQISQVVKQVKSNRNGITGIFHFAGSNRDAFLLKKTRMESQEVLAAKVQGTLLLEQALQGEKVDFVTFFSSASAAIGNIGQADYAYANSVLDAIAVQRSIAGSRTFSVNWALWEAGSMQLSPQKREAMTSGMGIKGMTSELGIAAWEAVLHSSVRHCLFLAGDDVKIRGFITKELAISSPVPRPGPVNIHNLYEKAEKIGKTLISPPVQVAHETYESIERFLKISISEVSRLPLDKISAQRNLDEFGLDSLMIMALNDKLIARFGTLPATLLFEYSDLEALANYLLGKQPVAQTASPEAITTENSTDSQQAPVTLSNSRQSSTISDIYRRAETIGQSKTVSSEVILPKLTPAPVTVSDPVLHKESDRLTASEVKPLTPTTTRETYESIERFLKASVSEVSRLPLDKISVQRSLDEFGLDSLMIMALNDKLIARFGTLPATLLFEYPNLGALAHYLLGKQPVAPTASPAAISSENSVDSQPSAVSDIYRRAETIGQSKTVSPEIVRPKLTPAPATVSDPVFRKPSERLTASVVKPLTPTTTRETYESIERFLKTSVSEVSRLPLDKISAQRSLDEFALDSLMIMALNDKLIARFGALPATLLFEYPNLGALAHYLLGKQPVAPTASPAAISSENSVDSQPSAVSDIYRRAETIGQSKTVSPESVFPKLTPAPITVSDPVFHKASDKLSDDIAIIGVSGIYPEANNLEAFWENLKAGKDSVTLIPEDRWAIDTYFDADRNKAMQGKMYSKWGGFIEDVDCFDAAFFNISPREAKLMDPTERLFLQTAWATFEDAGYTRKKLAQSCDMNVGVFAGISSYAYSLWGPEEWEKGNNCTPCGGLWSIANRVSYVMNLNGPSYPVDTACSSSLSAIHQACISLKNDECKMALIGGASLNIHPQQYIGMCQNQMLSPVGKCHSFGEKGDGFVPGEGVGAMLLKPLAKALADGDTIHAVIKGSAVNHGGKTNGYAVPNPKAQAGLIRTALKDAKIDPLTISYFEAHGTGTALGDPVEFEGLRQAWTDDGVKSEKKPWCSLGSVKSNIGHLHAAAGISGLTKILLQMKHKMLAPSLHAETPNSKIQFNDSPFFIQQKLSPWKTNQAGEPRRAAISSFGAGGSNAHIIIEEPPLGAAQTAVDSMSPSSAYLIPLSARSREQLIVYAEKMLVFWEKHQDKVSLQNFAYTLQTGREAMSERLAFIVREKTDVSQKLRAFLTHNETVDHDQTKRHGVFTANDLFVGQIDEHNVLPSGDDSDLSVLLVAANHQELAKRWVAGADIDWMALSQGQPAQERRCISLPTYPFAKKSYWYPGPGTAKITAVPEVEMQLPTIDDLLLQYQDALQDLAQLGSSGLLKAFQQLGCLQQPGETYTPEQLKARLCLQPGYDQLYDALLLILETAGYVSIKENLVQSTGQVSPLVISHDFDYWVSKHPELGANFRLLLSCLDNLPAILQGNIPATDIIFPDSSMVLVEKIYKNNAIADYYNQMVVDEVVRFVRNKLSTLPADKKLNILEIGAGTGGTSAAVFAALVPYQEHIHYDYTDLSLKFIQHGRQHYGDYTFAGFEILDIERPVKQQGFAVQDTDLLIATNVLHATRNLTTTLSNAKSLLRKGGGLIINEAVETHVFSTLTFGLLSGWWLAEDGHKRLPGSPLLSVDLWTSILQETGFTAVKAIAPQVATGVSQNVLIANSDGKLAVEQTIPLTTIQTRPAIADTSVGELPDIAEKVQNIAQRLGEIVAEVIELEPKNVNPDSTYSNMGVDSIVAIEIINQVNQALNITLRTTALFDHATVNQLAAHIVARHGDSISVSPNEDESLLTIFQQLHQGELDTQTADSLLN